MKKLVLSLINLYRNHLSQLKRRPTCPYVPTCSKYAYEAVQVHGVFYGLCLALWRIIRCNPFSKGGYDPVPPKKHRS